MEKLISVYEAAEILGCSHQTVLNWCEKGFIKRHELKRGKATFAAVDKNTIVELIDDAQAIEQSKQRISELRKEIEAEEREFTFKKRMAALLKLQDVRISEFQGLAMSVVKFLSATLKERERSVLLDFINGDSIEYMADKYGLSRERIRQIISKACRQMLQAKGFGSILEENKRLTEENALLKSSNIALTQELEHANGQLSKWELLTADEQDIDATSDDLKLVKLLKTKIDFHTNSFSVRALNALNSLDVQTIGDLAQLEAKDVLHCRNVGKKTLVELDDFLYSLHLGFSTDVNAIYKRVGKKIVTEDKIKTQDFLVD